MLHLQFNSLNASGLLRAAPRYKKLGARSFGLAGLSFLTVLSQAQTSPPAQTPPAQTSPPATTPPAKPQDWNFHAQNTDVVQGDLSFRAKYSGPNSLSSSGQVQETTDLDLYYGKRLWKGAEVHVDELIWQGFGLSQTLGVEAFPSGDAYKYGTLAPDMMFARLFIRQTFGLGGEQEAVADGPLTLAGMQDVRRITVTAGRLSPTDICDTNTYAGDPHTQFMNWAFINNLTWDYDADSVGFAPGIAVELSQPKWALRYCWFEMPPVANSFTGDDAFLMYPNMGAFGPPLKEWGMNMELERRYTVREHPGTIRLDAWLNEANMYSYDAATRLLLANGPNADLSPAQSYSYKYGFGLNWEQEVAKNVGMFSRLGWNDGQEEAWAFTDANWSGSLGLSLNGGAWRRPGDTIGIAGVVSGASAAQQRFLEAGGTGILDGDGDGALNYAPEEVLETYYDTHLTKDIRCTFDYQFVNNPAFNQDRGPVSIFGLRLHWEF